MMIRTDQLIMALALAVAVAGGMLQRCAQRSQEPATRLARGQAVPALKLTDLDGKPHSLADYRGQRVLLHAWAPWCGPCVEELPQLVRWQTGHPDAPRLVGIALDEPAKVRAFLEQHAIESFTTLIGSLDEPPILTRLGDTRHVLPYSVLLDAQGKVLATHVGALGKNGLLQQWQEMTAP